ncbi:beta-galactosidase [Streptomyces phaeoluteigriseus]|uniref:beta-galactosidase n=1 Tax=Streptomyces phaeoluteigriseus TaxID=114686 RepID=UPI00367A2AC4
MPPWLARRYPADRGRAAHRRARRVGCPAGGRLHHPAFRFDAERVIREVVARYARHPAAIGFRVGRSSHAATRRRPDRRRPRNGPPRAGRCTGRRRSGSRLRSVPFARTNGTS